MDNELEELKNLYGKEKLKLTPGFNFEKTGAVNEMANLKKEQLKMVFTFILTAVIIIYVDYVSFKKMETSRLGFYVLLSCSTYYAAYKYFLYRKLRAINPALPVLKLIEQVESYKKTNRFFATYGEMLYVIVLSFGVYLYLQPILIHLTDGPPNKYFKFLKFIWFAFLVWAFINTFIIKRKKLKKETEVLEKYLSQLRNDGEH